MTNVAPLIFALPSKGRLKEQAEAWLADCGLKLEVEGGARGYRARLPGLPGAEVRLLSAADIAAGLDSGDVHLGVTGEDLLRERGDDLDRHVFLLRALGFGRADLVVAAPQSWIDVDSMADVADVAHLYLARTGGRLRVATKYAVQTRAFFGRFGVGDYRIVESLGATEGAPAAGQAELVVDITTTGATLAANNLKVVGDGVMLRSQAQLAASLIADWRAGHLDALRRFLRVIEARGRAAALVSLRWPPEQEAAARGAVARLAQAGLKPQGQGLLAPAHVLFDVCEALAQSGVAPVTVGRPDYVFEAGCAPVDTLIVRMSG